jgi:hypothetical protein
MTEHDRYLDCLRQRIDVHDAMCRPSITKENFNALHRIRVRWNTLIGQQMVKAGLEMQQSTLG